MTPVYAVVPSDGRDHLRGCIQSLRGQVDRVVVVANGGFSGTGSDDCQMVADPGADRNISRWWNLGLEEAQRLALGQGASGWSVLVVNDDVVCPPNLVGYLSTKLVQYGATLAYPNQHDGLEAVWTRAEPVNLFHRITGYCWMIRGESELRLDESLVWWYGDDDLEWRAREANGAVLVPGCRVEHLEPNRYLAENPGLQIQAGRDRGTFQRKWGKTPW